MNDNERRFVIDHIPQQPAPEPRSFVAYTAGGEVIHGAWNWETCEVTWGEPVGVPVGTIIESGYDLFADAAVRCRWRWNGQQWEATDDE